MQRSQSVNINENESQNFSVVDSGEMSLLQENSIDEAIQVFDINAIENERSRMDKAREDLDAARMRLHRRQEQELQLANRRGLPQRGIPKQGNISIAHQGYISPPKFKQPKDAVKKSLLMVEAQNQMYNRTLGLTTDNPSGVDLMLLARKRQRQTDAEQFATPINLENYQTLASLEYDYKIKNKDKQFIPTVFEGGSKLSFSIYSDEFIDPMSLFLELTVINTNLNNYLQFDMSPIKRLTIINNGRVIEDIVDYHLIFSILNDVHYNSRIYKPYDLVNDFHRKNEKVDDDPFIAGSRTVLIPPYYLGSSTVFNPKALQGEEWIGLNGGQLFTQHLNYKILNIPIYSFIFGRCFDKEIILPDAILDKTQKNIVPMFLFRSLEIQIELNEFAFFVPSFATIPSTKPTINTESRLYGIALSDKTIKFCLSNNTDDLKFTNFEVHPKHDYLLETDPKKLTEIIFENLKRSAVSEEVLQRLMQYDRDKNSINNAEIYSNYIDDKMGDIRILNENKFLPLGLVDIYHLPIKLDYQIFFYKKDNNLFRFLGCRETFQDANALVDNHKLVVLINEKGEIIKEIQYSTLADNVDLFGYDECERSLAAFDTGKFVLCKPDSLQSLAFNITSILNLTLSAPIETPSIKTNQLFMFNSNALLTLSFLYNNDVKTVESIRNQKNPHSQLIDQVFCDKIKFNNSLDMKRWTLNYDNDYDAFQNLMTYCGNQKFFFQIPTYNNPNWGPNYSTIGLNSIHAVFYKDAFSDAFLSTLFRIDPLVFMLAACNCTQFDNFLSGKMPSMKQEHFNRFAMRAFSLNLMQLTEESITELTDYIFDQFFHAIEQSKKFKVKENRRDASLTEYIEAIESNVARINLGKAYYSFVGQLPSSYHFFFWFILGTMKNYLEQDKFNIMMEGLKTYMDEGRIVILDKINSELAITIPVKMRYFSDIVTNFYLDIPELRQNNVFNSFLGHKNISNFFDAGSAGLWFHGDDPFNIESVRNNSITDEVLNVYNAFMAKSDVDIGNFGYGPQAFYGLQKLRKLHAEFPIKTFMLSYNKVFQFSSNNIVHFGSFINDDFLYLASTGRNAVEWGEYMNDAKINALKNEKFFLNFLTEIDVADLWICRCKVVVIKYLGESWFLVFIKKENAVLIRDMPAEIDTMSKFLDFRATAINRMQDLKFSNIVNSLDKKSRLLVNNLIESVNYISSVEKYKVIFDQLLFVMKSVCEDLLNQENNKRVFLSDLSISLIRSNAVHILTTEFGYRNQEFKGLNYDVCKNSNAFSEEYRIQIDNPNDTKDKDFILYYPTYTLGSPLNGAAFLNQVLLGTLAKTAKPVTDYITESDISRQWQYKAKLKFKEIIYRDKSIKDDVRKAGFLVKGIRHQIYNTTSFEMELPEQNNFILYNPNVNKMYFAIYNKAYTAFSTVRASNRYALNINLFGIEINDIKYPNEFIQAPITDLRNNYKYLELLEESFDVGDSIINKYNISASTNTSAMIARDSNGIQLSFNTKGDETIRQKFPNYYNELQGKCLFAINFKVALEKIGDPNINLKSVKKILINFDTDKEETLKFQVLAHSTSPANSFNYYDLLTMFEYNSEIFIDGEGELKNLN